MAFDPFNLLLLAIALVVFWRLKSVLGTRTGNERPPVDPLGSSRPGEPVSPTADPDKKVVRFPQPDSAAQESQRLDEPQVPIWDGYAEPGSDLAGAIERLASMDPSFSPKSFVDGAKIAYEMIIDAFARGDKQALKPLLSREVFDGFSRAIDQREAAGQRVESKFVGINKANISAVRLSGSKASVIVEFVSELISATWSKSGEVIDGDPTQIHENSDVWTFERDTTSRNPNWKLVATQAPA